MNRFPYPLKTFQVRPKGRRFLTLLATDKSMTPQVFHTGLLTAIHEGRKESLWTRFKRFLGRVIR